MTQLFMLGADLMALPGFEEMSLMKLFPDKLAKHTKHRALCDCGGQHKTNMAAFLRPG